MTQQETNDSEAGIKQLDDEKQIEIIPSETHIDLTPHYLYPSCVYASQHCRYDLSCEVRGWPDISPECSQPMPHGAAQSVRKRPDALATSGMAMTRIETPA